MVESKEKSIFIELMQTALGSRQQLSLTPSVEEWNGIYQESIRQAVIGVAFEGVKILPKEQWPPTGLKFQWIGHCEQLRQQNILLNKRCAEITHFFAKEGFHSCILKGQGNALMYPNTLSRTPGDIDIWVAIDGGRLKGDGRGLSVKEEREIITRFVKRRTPNVFEQYHHIDFPIFNDVPVEVHYTPVKLLNPICNRKFQRYCREIFCKQVNNYVVFPDGTGNICVPTADFNLIYQMAHLMYHFFVEGIGLRQFVDYFFVLKKIDERRLENENYNALFREFGLLKFARGAMWIEKACLGLEDHFLIVEPDEKKGRLILKEMIEGGNFGQYDNRYKGRSKGYWRRGILDGLRILRLSRTFPYESMWKLYMKVENQRWKIKSKR